MPGPTKLSLLSAAAADLLVTGATALVALGAALVQLAAEFAC
jgi:hypothetical protein